MSYLPIVVILLGSLLLRAFAAWVSVGFENPAEVHRLLEPMADLLGYTTRTASEWMQGLQSELPVRAHLRALALLRAVGVYDSLFQIQLLRLLYAVLSLAPILVTWRFVRCSGAPEKLALLAAAILGFWPEWVYSSVRLLPDSLEASLSAVSFGLLFWNWRRSAEWRPSRRAAALAGIPLGLLLFIRPSSVLIWAALEVVLLWLGGRRARPVALVLAASFGITVVLSSLVEWRFYSKTATAGMLTPIFNALTQQWGGADGFFDPQTWRSLLGRAGRFYGFAATVLFVLMMIRRRIQWPWAFLALVPFFAGALFLPLDGRMNWGSLWLWVPAAFCSLRFFTVIDRRVWGTVIGLALIAGYLVNSVSVRERFLVRAQEVKEFAEIGKLLDLVASEQQSHGASPSGGLKGTPGRMPLLRIDGDPRVLPGAFFLRYRGPACYRDECPPLPGEDAYLTIYKDTAGVWVLERHDVDDI